MIGVTGLLLGVPRLGEIALTRRSHEPVALGHDDDGGRVAVLVASTRPSNDASARPAARSEAVWPRSISHASHPRYRSTPGLSRADFEMTRCAPQRPFVVR